MVRVRNFAKECNNEFVFLVNLVNKGQSLNYRSMIGMISGKSTQIDLSSDYLINDAEFQKDLFNLNMELLLKYYTE